MSQRSAASADATFEPRSAEGGDVDRRHRRFGWTLLAVAAAFGSTLEALLAFKAVPYLEDPLRRQFWSLAHFHAAFFSLANVAFAQQLARRAGGVAAPSPSTSWALLAGSTLMPLGFFLGGLVHPEGDPGLGIFLAPPGGLCLLYAFGALAFGAWREKR